MGHVIISKYTTLTPLQFIGESAGYCWGSNTKDPEVNIKRAIDCIACMHGRTMEFPNISLVLVGYSARVIREWYTHRGGDPTRLQSSTRYVDAQTFGYVTPHTIEANPEAKKVYDETIESIRAGYAKLEELGIKREDAAMVLPLGMETVIVDKRNFRNLVDMSRQRMCTRAYWEYRELFNDIINALSTYSGEWNTLIKMCMKPKCEELGYCPEKKGCGRKPSREEFNKIVEAGKEALKKSK